MLVERFNFAISAVFSPKSNDILDLIFKGNEEVYEEYKKLEGTLKELENLKRIVKLPKPFVVEFIGAPFSGKTTVINSIYDLLEDSEFSVEKYSNDLSNTNICDLDIQLKDAIEKNNDIILIGNSVNSMMVYEKVKCGNDSVGNERLKKVSKCYKKIIEDKSINILFYLFTNVKTALARKYEAKPSLRNKDTNAFLEIQKFNSILSEHIYNEKVAIVYKHKSTDKETPNKTCIEIIKTIMCTLRQEYLKELNEEILKVMSM